MRSDSEKYRPGEAHLKKLMTFPIMKIPRDILHAPGYGVRNGDVVPCIYHANHEYVLGNLKDNCFKDIWNSEKMLTLRRSMLDNNYLQHSSLCEHCIVLGMPPIYGIPSGIRLALADSITNLVGYKFERLALAAANKIQRNRFSAKTIYS